MNTKRPRFDLTGQTFGRLSVVGAAQVQREAPASFMWSCMCECGSERIVSSTQLRSGNTRSCGCLQREIAKKAGDRTRTHGMSGTSTHNIWDSMIQRCTNASRKDYPRYGGRGIKVCDRWMSFECFLSDMGARPTGMSLNRKNNDGDYCPDNCEWATDQEQRRNTSKTRNLTYAGRTMCVAAWAEELQMPTITLSSRLRRGWTESLALSTPVDKRFSHVRLS